MPGQERQRAERARRRRLGHRKTMQPAAAMARRPEPMERKRKRRLENCKFPELAAPIPRRPHHPERTGEAGPGYSMTSQLPPPSLTKILLTSLP